MDEFDEFGRLSDDDDSDDSDDDGGADSDDEDWLDDEFMGDWTMEQLQVRGRAGERARERDRAAAAVHASVAAVQGLTAYGTFAPPRVSLPPSSQIVPPCLRL
eukprot:SAG22_NODE_1944_length_3283_cov_13.320666_4_plen_103_part_00